MKDKELALEMKKRGFALSEDVIKELDAYAAMLAEWNQKINLTAITEPSEVVEKHFYDCLLPLTEIKIAGAIADVGSGAGFPGLVWAIADPSLSITLIEPTGKRCVFLNEVKQKLHLDSVVVVNTRSEDYAKDHRECFDVVTARAVAGLPILSELCMPLVKEGGVFLAMKGRAGKDEAKEAAHAAEVLGCSEPKIFDESLPSGEERINLVYEKVKPTPAIYPRNYGRIKKKPL